MAKIYELSAIREQRDRSREISREMSEEELGYRARILAMEKVELLEEMVRFQEERTAAGRLTPNMMKRGQVLFRALEQTAETQELRLLARSYRRHLEHELAAYLQDSRSNV